MMPRDVGSFKYLRIYGIQIEFVLFWRPPVPMLGRPLQSTVFEVSAWASIENWILSEQASLMALYSFEPFC